MLSIAGAEAYVAQLEQEATNLQAAHDDLIRQRADAKTRLEKAYVAKERSPSRDNEREAIQAKSALTLIEEQAQSKKVALSDCQADLVTARADVEASKRAAAVVQLEAVYSEMAEVVAGLDRNISQLPLWAQLNALTTRGNSLFFQLRDLNDYTWRPPLIDIPIVAGRAVDTLRMRLDKTFNPNIQRGAEIRFPTVAAAADLDAFKKRLDHLRQVHIAPLEQAPAPVLEAVFA